MAVTKLMRSEDKPGKKYHFCSIQIFHWTPSHARITRRHLMQWSWLTGAKSKSSSRNNRRSNGSTPAEYTTHDGGAHNHIISLSHRVGSLLIPDTHCGRGWRYIQLL